MRVGAIDIGSNSVRLLIADVTQADGGKEDLRVVVRAGEACRLGRGLAASGRIDDEIAARAAAITFEFVQRGRSLSASHLLIGATAALRDATNGAEVAAAISARCGIPVRILSGDDEARLVYKSVVHGLGIATRGQACVVFDLGGGSTEVVSGVGLQPGRWASLPFGAVSLTDRFLHTDPPGPNEIAALRAAVRADLMQHCAYMPERVPLLAGVGGTVTVLAATDRGIQAYDPNLLEGWSIPPQRLTGMIERLVTLPRHARGSWPVMGEGRADIVAAGALVVEELVGRFPSGGLVCSTQGLRFGLARLAAEEARAMGHDDSAIPPIGPEAAGPPA
jgi:exopolyphosphatase / guanosine-5'-triphosphate,3'-diphosphate pyrophosphatase